MYLLVTLKLLSCFQLEFSFDFFIVPGFLVFINLYCIKYGALALQEIFDSIQPKLVWIFILLLLLLLLLLLFFFSQSRNSCDLQLKLQTVFAPIQLPKCFFYNVVDLSSNFFSDLLPTVPYC